MNGALNNMSNEQLVANIKRIEGNMMNNDSLNDYLSDLYSELKRREEA